MSTFTENPSLPLRARNRFTAIYRDNMAFRRTARILAALAGSLTSLGLAYSLPYTQATFIWLYPLATVAPLLVTFVFSRTARRTWYRALVIAGLLVSTVAEFIPVMILAAMFWALYRAWFLDAGQASVDAATDEAQKAGQDVA